MRLFQRSVRRYGLLTRRPESAQSKRNPCPDQDDCARRRNSGNELTNQSAFLSGVNEADEGSQALSQGAVRKSSFT